MFLFGATFKNLCLKFYVFMELVSNYRNSYLEGVLV